MVFIKRFLVISSLSILLFSLIGCDGKKIGVANEKTELKNPPTLKVIYQDKSIEARRGTYTWTVDNNDGTNTTTNGDSPAPNELVKNSTPLIVPPKSNLTLDFTDKPENTIVNIWQDNKPIKQTITDNKLLMPGLKDSVVYEVIATWKQGTASYAFLVNIN